MENKTKADSKTVKEKAKTDLLVCVFGCFAGNGAVHGRQEGEREGSHYGPPHAFWISRRRVNPRAASCDGAWSRRAAAAPAVPEGLCSSWTF